MIQATGNAMSGIRSATKLLEKAAEQLSLPNSEDMDIPKQIQRLEIATHSLKTDIKAVQAADEAEKRLLDMFA